MCRCVSVFIDARRKREREREREEGKKRKRTSRRMNLGAGKVGKYSKLGFKSLTGTGGAKFGWARGSSALMAQSVNGVLYESLCLLCIHDSDVRSFVRDCTPRLDDLLVHKLSTELSSSSFLLYLYESFFSFFKRSCRIEVDLRISVTKRMKRIG